MSSCLHDSVHVSGDKLSSVSAERDQLKDKVTALTQEKDGLQLLLKQSECWSVFDCGDQGADLVIIDSLEEQVTSMRK
uniref:Uncharacterized protein n=1 Tax=Gasterosteus aculeatus aculeatus TaxID=481459 RepID=A0AAQ4P1H5_GASAC